MESSIHLRRSLFPALALLIGLTSNLTGQVLEEKLDLSALQRIRDEGMTHSRVDTLAQQLLDGIGPRLTGSSGLRKAQDWDATTLAFQKVGYDGVWMFELAVAADRKPVLEQAAKARERLESLLHIGDEMLGMDEG